VRGGGGGARGGAGPAKPVAVFWAGIEIAVPFPKPFFMSTSTTTMSTVDIANRLVELCRIGDFETAQKELFSADAVSIEPYGTPDFEKEIKGLDAIIEKGKKWGEMVQEMHGGEVSEPLLADSSFAVTMSMDMTMKNGQRMNMKELCIYHVKDGKIVSEQFFM
jgi:ketosteroid isomerase-like protein